MTAAVVCGVLFVGAVAVSIRLAWFLRDCDRRHAAALDNLADLKVIAEAERIVAAAYTTDPSTWPR